MSKKELTLSKAHVEGALMEYVFKYYPEYTEVQVLGFNQNGATIIIKKEEK